MSAINPQLHGSLIALASSNKNTQHQLIRVLDRQVIRILSQIAQNILSGNIPLKRRKLKGYFVIRTRYVNFGIIKQSIVGDVFY